MVSVSSPLPISSPKRKKYFPRRVGSKVFPIPEGVGGGQFRGLDGCNGQDTCQGAGHIGSVSEPGGHMCEQQAHGPS